MGPRAEATGLLRCVGIGSLIALQVSNGFGKVWTELRSVPGKPKFSHRAKGTMNLKNFLLSLEAISQITGAACRMLKQKQNRDGNPEYSHGAAADLLAAGVVVPRSKPAAGIEPASRRAIGQNLSRRHPLLFMRWLLVLISGYVCQGASPVPIAATAILDTPPNFNGGAGAGLLTDGVVGGNNWLSTHGGTWAGRTRVTPARTEEPIRVCPSRN